MIPLFWCLVMSVLSFIPAMTPWITSECDTYWPFSSQHQWQIQDFSLWGGGNPEGVRHSIISQFFAENCMKMQIKETGPRGRCVPSAPLDPSQSMNDCLIPYSLVILFQATVGVEFIVLRIQSRNCIYTLYCWSNRCVYIYYMSCVLIFSGILCDKGHYYDADTLHGALYTECDGEAKWNLTDADVTDCWRKFSINAAQIYISDLILSDFLLWDKQSLICHFFHSHTVWKPTDRQEWNENLRQQHNFTCKVQLHLGGSATFTLSVKVVIFLSFHNGFYGIYLSVHTCYFCV